MDQGEMRAKIADDLEECFPHSCGRWPEIVDLVLDKGRLPFQIGDPESRILSSFVIAAALATGADLPRIGKNAGCGAIPEILNQMSIGVDFHGVRPSKAEEQAQGLRTAFGQVAVYEPSAEHPAPLAWATQQECDILLTTRSPKEKSAKSGGLTQQDIAQALADLRESADAFPLARLGAIYDLPLVVHVPFLRSETQTQMPHGREQEFATALKKASAGKERREDEVLLEFDGKTYRIEKSGAGTERQPSLKIFEQLSEPQAHIDAFRLAIEPIVLSSVFKAHSTLVVGKGGAVQELYPFRTLLESSNSLKNSGLVQDGVDRITAFLKRVFPLSGAPSERYASFGNDHDHQLMDRAVQMMALAIEQGANTPMFEGIAEVIGTDCRVARDDRHRPQGPAIRYA